MHMQEQPDVNRNRLPTIPDRAYTWNKPLRVGHRVMPRAPYQIFQTKSCAELRPYTLLRRQRRRSRSCPPVLPDFHHFEFDCDDPIVRRIERNWAFKYPEEARQYLIMESARASWMAWEGWSNGWQEGSRWSWNSTGSGWSAYDAWAWINRDQDPTFIMTCIEAVTAAMGEEAAWAAAATPWWVQQHGGDSGGRGSRD